MSNNSVARRALFLSRRRNPFLNTLIACCRTEKSTRLSCKRRLDELSA
jgi:hypothetical protein